MDKKEESGDKIHKIVVYLGSNISYLVSVWMAIVRAVKFGVKMLWRNVPCDVKSYVTLFTAIRVNHLYHQMTLGL